MESVITRPEGEALDLKLKALQFASLFKHAYMEASEEVQEVIIEMVSICNSEDSSSDEVAAAVDTLVEALFPTSAADGMLGIEIGELRKVQNKSLHESVFAEFDVQEQRFADRLEALLTESGMTQADLASRIGVGQPAISMMLNRKCRPQRRTIEKIADAFGIKPEELWEG